MGSGLNILVLDDEPLIRLMVVSGLESAGHCVEEADSCSAALRLLRRGQFDVGVFDYRLPDGCSVDLLRTMRGENNNLPVLLLSAEASALENALDDDLGVVAILSKPPNVDEILKVLAGSVSGGQPAELPQAGAFRVWSAVSGDVSYFEALDDSARVVVDCSEFDADVLPGAVEAFLCGSGVRAALAGASAALMARLKAANAELVGVDALEELAAQARRYNSLAERSALLGSIVRRDND